MHYLGLIPTLSMQGLVLALLRGRRQAAMQGHIGKKEF
jgi:hypothetical protein